MGKREGAAKQEQGACYVIGGHQTEAAVKSGQDLKGKNVERGHAKINSQKSDRAHRYMEGVRKRLVYVSLQFRNVIGVREQV